MVCIRCLAQLVNVTAPIMTEPGGGGWRQASYHPFALTSRYGRGMVLRLPLQSPACETGAFGDVPVPVLDAVAVASDEGGVTLFAVNRDQATPVALDVDVRSLPSRAGGACRFNRCRRRLGAGTQEGWPKSRCPAATLPGLC